MKKLFAYLASTNGRTVRFILGILIVASGLFVSPTLVVVGLLPIFAAIFDICILAPLFKYPFEGEKLRDTVAK